MASLQSIPIDVIIKSATKYTEENPVAVGTTAVVTTVLAGFLFLRKKEMKRDGSDYDSQLTGGLKILNNADHTLKVTNLKLLSIYVTLNRFYRVQNSINLLWNTKICSVELESLLELSHHKNQLRLKSCFFLNLRVL
jgi:hypothetical protein